MTSELLKTHFGFTAQPFSLTPDPDFMFWSPLHRRAYSVLEYGLLSGAPITVMTGNVGAGKTTLVQHLLGVVPSDMTVGLISNAQGNRGDLLRWILNALDVRPSDPKDPVTLFEDFQDFVIAEYSQGRSVVLVIDEAQNLGEERLEELRMLTNINSGKDELLQLLLVGQPELRTLLCRPALRQFAQRVSISYHLDAMNQEATQAYILHRLRHAGGTGEEFTAEAVDRIFYESGGIPRVVNKLCDLSLVYAASADCMIVIPETIDELINDGLLIQSGGMSFPDGDMYFSAMTGSERDAAE